MIKSKDGFPPYIFTPRFLYYRNIPLYFSRLSKACLSIYQREILFYSYSLQSFNCFELLLQTVNVIIAISLDLNLNHVNY